MTIAQKAVKILNKKYNINKVDVAIVSGSGLAKSSPDLENPITVNYKSLGLPPSKVDGHSGSFVFGTYNGKNIAIVSRMHFYESSEISKVRLPLEIMNLLGAKMVILLTSCGGINKNFQVGDIMLIEDQINMSGINPLIGLSNIKFVNMIDCYSPALKNKTNEIAKENGIKLQHGIFCQLSGPSYETPAEIEMLRRMGADSVSMSTAHDCIIAKYFDMEVVGFSAIVNVCSAEVKELGHDEVVENAGKICKNLKIILSSLLKN